MKNTVLAGAVKRAFELNLVPFLIDRETLADATQFGTYVSAKPISTFTVETGALTSSEDLIAEDHVELGAALGHVKITRLHPEIEKAVEHARAHQSQYSALIFDHRGGAAATVLNTVSNVAVHRHLGPIGIPSNLKIIVIVDDDAQVATLDPRHRSRFRVCYVTAHRTSLVTA